jgi:hypothetical protein
LFVTSPDLAGDISGVQVSINDVYPDAQISNTLMQGMKSGTIYGISFYWSQIVLYTVNGKLEFVINKTGMHKVAVSGFRTDAGEQYPIIINDASNGTTVAVRLTADVGSLNLPGISAAAAKSASFGLLQSDGTIQPAKPGAPPPVFFVYEGSEPSGSPTLVTIGGKSYPAFNTVAVEDVWSIDISPKTVVKKPITMGTKYIPQAWDIPRPSPDPVERAQIERIRATLSNR